MQERGETISSSLRQKAILFTFRGIQGINAETVVARHYELKALVEHFKRVEHIENYSIPHDNLKPTMNWSVEWGPRQDSRLLIGIWRYGFGAWDLIKGVSGRSIDHGLTQQDPDLQLTNMIFLDDPKVVKDPGTGKSGIPGPIHLVRRGDYLCGIIREYEENRRMLIEQQAVIANMPVKEGFGYDHPPLPVPPTYTASTASSSKDKGKRRKTPEYTDSEEEEYESMDEDAVKELLRPAKRHLVSATKRCSISQYC